MIIEILLHPFTLSVTLIFSIIFLKDLLGNGSKMYKVYGLVYHHINMMAKDNIDDAWKKLSFDVRTILTQKKRLKKGKDNVGTRRLSSFALQHATVYQRANLIIDSIHVVKVKAPRQMYMIRLRSQNTGYMRMTIWVSKVPYRVDGWSINEICVHPNHGDLNRGDTLTGVRMKRRPSRIQKAIKNKKSKKMKPKSLAKAS
jgi:hypothetical protein